MVAAFRVCQSAIEWRGSSRLVLSEYYPASPIKGLKPLSVKRRLRVCCRPCRKWSRSFGLVPLGDRLTQSPPGGPSGPYSSHCTNPRIFVSRLRGRAVQRTSQDSIKSWDVFVCTAPIRFHLSRRNAGIPSGAFGKNMSFSSSGPHSDVFVQVQRGRNVFSFTAPLQSFDSIVGAFEISVDHS
jgi:hypothetical protein